MTSTVTKKPKGAGSPGEAHRRTGQVTSQVTSLKHYQFSHIGNSVLNPNCHSLDMSPVGRLQNNSEAS